MKKKISLFIMLCITLISISACSKSKYKQDDFVGKTSKEIVKQYGEFDCTGMKADTDGVYKNTSCGYTIKEESKGFIDKHPEQLFFIRFDENGVATECYEDNRPGG